MNLVRGGWFFAGGPRRGEAAVVVERNYGATRIRKALEEGFIRRRLLGEDRLGRRPGAAGKKCTCQSTNSEVPDEAAAQAEQSLFVVVNLGVSRRDDNVQFSIPIDVNHMRLTHIDL